MKTGQCGGGNNNTYAPKSEPVELRQKAKSETWQSTQLPCFHGHIIPNGTTYERRRVNVILGNQRGGGTSP